MDRLCIECKYWTIYAAEEGYSDWTPGSDFQMFCSKNHWTLDPYRDSEDKLREYYETAKECKDFVSRKGG
jgi:hypothetical protein